MTAKPGILNISEIAAAIRAAMPDLVACGTASDFGRLQAEGLRVPSAYVLALNEQPGQDRYQTDAVMSQRVVARFGVVWSVRDIADRLGRIAEGEIQAVRTQGMAVICGLRLANTEGPCVPVAAKLISNIGRNGQMLWQDDFAVPLNRHIPIVQGA